MPHPAQEPAPSGRLTAEISNTMVRLLRDRTGRGPTKARTTIARDHVLVALGDTLTKGERTLVEAGYVEDVLRVRRRFQAAMKDEAVAAVEQLTGRKVVGFVSENHIDPDLAIEVFIFEPSDSHDHELAEGEADA